MGDKMLILMSITSKGSCFLLSMGNFWFLSRNLNIICDKSPAVFVVLSLSLLY